MKELYTPRAFSKQFIQPRWYTVRILSAIFCIQFLFLLLLKIPDTSQDSSPNEFQGFNSIDIALIDDIAITRQEGSPPSPPKPSFVPPIPRDVVIEDPLLMPEDNLLFEFPPLPDATGRGGAVSSQSIVQRPQRPPSALKIVEPQLDSFLDASMRGRVRIRVNFLVDERGRVEEASIIEILLQDEDGKQERVTFLKNGLDEAALKAALQWEFRPARHDGVPVRAYANGTFRF